MTELDNMTELEELNEYLGRQYGIDAWSDFAVDGAAELLNRLKREQWAHLTVARKARSLQWQQRLADAAGLSTADASVELLLDMLAETDMKIAVTAAEALDGKDDVWTPDASLRPVLERLHEAASNEADRENFRVLLDRIVD